MRLKTNNIVIYLRIYVLILVAILSCGDLFSQGNKIEYRTGKVTFIASEHVYVQFESTDSIKISDTLFQRMNGILKPIMEVKFISSRSCACVKDSSYAPKLNDEIVAIIRVNEKSINKEQPKIDTAVVISNSPVNKEITETKVKKKNYSGRFSVQSLTNLTNTDKRNNYQRWRHTFSFKADSISGSAFSTSAYLFFAYNTRDWNEVKDNLGRALKIYDLSISYKPTNKNQLWFGRHLNYRVSNVGSIDGITFQQTIGNYYLGALVGSHPDFMDYGYNIKMFEYGVYFSRADTFATTQMENSIAYFNQTNNFKTDRRYLYYQHTNNLLTYLNFFASSEVDLFKREKGTGKTSLTLTSIYLNLYYNPIRELSFSLSYDARRNVVYYETYKSFIDSLFENEIRQGYRLSVLVRPFNKLTLSLNGGYRFQKNDLRPSKNFGANLYYSSIPFVDVSGNFTYTNLVSSYTDGETIGIRLSKYINLFDINISADFRMIKYKFRYSSEQLKQNILSGDISFKLPTGIYLGLNYEGTFEKYNTYGRIYIDLTKRF